MAQKLLTLPKVPRDTNYVAAPVSVAVAWQYPPGIKPELFCWTLEASTDLVHWSPVPFQNPKPYAHSPGCLDGGSIVSNTNPFCFFRLMGTQLFP